MGSIKLDFFGAIHHVFQRGNNKQAIFLDDDDRAFFIGYLNALKRECDFKLYALCLMSNHVHLLLETGQVALRVIMQRLETAYAMRFNAKHERVGHLFQNRYQAKLCTRDAYFLRLVRYIHRNPVKAGMVSRCGDYPWSGHRALAAAADGLFDVGFPLSFFGPSLTEAARAYALFADDRGDDAWSPNFDGESALGLSEELTELLLTVSADHGLTPGQITSGSKGPAAMAAKRAFIQRGFDQGFYQAQLARALRCSEPTVLYLRRTANPKNPKNDLKP